jgi:hypothetical protein
MLRAVNADNGNENDCDDYSEGDQHDATPINLPTDTLISRASRRPKVAHLSERMGATSPNA